jgi:hypothetical protein
LRFTLAATELKKILGRDVTNVIASWFARIGKRMYTNVCIGEGSHIITGSNNIAIGAGMTYHFAGRNVIIGRQ